MTLASHSLPSGIASSATISLIYLHASLKGTPHWHVLYFCVRCAVFKYILTLIIQELHLGFVTYGHRGDRVPVFFKRFFSVGAHNELKENPAIPFTGHVSTGGSEGMAALDGYAAAIEVNIYFVHSIYTHDVLILTRCLTSSKVTSTKGTKSSLVTYGTLQPGDLTMLITHICIPRRPFTASHGRPSPLN